MDGFEEIKITAPVPGTCRKCATAHKPGEPHDRDSLYYQRWFRRGHDRLPTWQDAMSHCSEATKAAFIKELASRGIVAKGDEGNGT